LIADSPGLAVVLDQRGIVDFIGGRALDKLGITAKDVVRTPVLEFYDYPPDVADHLERAVAGASFRDRGEFRGLTFEARWSPLRGESGEITGTIGIALDITERVSAERSRDEVMRASRC
jgi:PAS domain S-box-containing protein